MRMPRVGACKQKLMLWVPLCDMKQTSPPPLPAARSGKLHNPIDGLYRPMQFGPTSAISDSAAVARSSRSSLTPSSSPVSEKPEVKNPMPLTPAATQSLRMRDAIWRGTALMA